MCLGEVLAIYLSEVLVFAIAYTVLGQSYVLSGLDAQGLADSIAYSAAFGPVTHVTISTY